jgi:uncharacterized phage protein gp47/JayE
MTRSSLRYLSQNTDISYFEQGSVAKALVEATNLEIVRLQDFISSAMNNSFLSTANGIYLDLFGELLGIPRITDRAASASIQDGSVKFYVDSGTLGSKLFGSDPSIGLIPAGVEISTIDGSILFEVTENVSFPINARSAFAPVRARVTGSAFNVGANQLIVHSLTDKSIKVTNDISIVTGSDVESDSEYRFRLSKAFTTKYGSNKTAIQIAASSQPGVARSEIVPYVRGAGTFEVLLIPQGNRLTRTTIDNTKRIIEGVAAFGVSPLVREPTYVAIKIMGQLRFDPSIDEGERIAARRAAESGVLRYISSIPLGGELVLNQLRSAILSSNNFPNTNAGITATNNLV